jgi:hypothetical protein
MVKLKQSMIERRIVREHTCLFPYMWPLHNICFFKKNRVFLLLFLIITPLTQILVKIRSSLMHLWPIQFTVQSFLQSNVLIWNTKLSLKTGCLDLEHYTKVQWTQSVAYFDRNITMSCYIQMWRAKQLISPWNICNAQMGPTWKL